MEDPAFQKNERFGSLYAAEVKSQTKLISMSFQSSGKSANGFTFLIIRSAHFTAAPFETRTELNSFLIFTSNVK